MRVWESGFTQLADGGQVGRCRIAHPKEGWISGKCLDVLPQGVAGGPVPRANDFEAQFEMKPVQMEKKADGPPKTYVPASIKVVCLNVPDEERNGNTRYKIGWAHGQPTVTTDRESRANNEIYQWEAGKDGKPPELTARMSFHGFASRALPGAMTKAK